MKNEPTISDLGEEFENPPRGIRMIKTAQGSKYAYFDNGQTQRYKEAEKEYREPQDILVFVPDFAWFANNAPAEARTRFADEKQYDNFLILNIQGRQFSTKIVDAKGFVLKKSDDLKRPGIVYLVLTSKGDDGKESAVFHVPVAKAPRLGFYTFDMRTEETATHINTHRHLGNKVVEITKGDPLPASEIMPARKRDPHEIS